jgi:uncharacterized membrane protein
MTNLDWRYLVFLLFAHHPKQKLDHTIHLSFRNRHLYLCTRCTGIALGFITIWGFALFGLTLPMQFYVPLISVLPIVAVADWFTQSAKLRQSKTWLRVGSGYLLGLSESLGFLLLFTGFYVEFLLVVGVAAVYALAVFMIASRTRCLDAYVKEMNEF